METIIYQGQEIQATRVNYISGTFTTSTVDHDGDEDLFRDEAGRYYLRRQLIRLDSEGECREASGRTYVHRVGINAALLWATTRLNSETLDLRRDAAAMLMENRGYDDPDTTRARYIRGIFKRQELVEPTSTSGTRHFTDGSMTVTLHLKPEPARLLRKACERQGTRPLIEVYTAMAADVRALLGTDGEEDRAVEAIFDANIPDDEDDERTVVNLLHEDGTLYARVPLEPDLEAMLEAKAREEGADIGTALVNCLRRFHQQPPAAPDDTTEPPTVTVPLTLPTDLYQQILAMGAHDDRAALSETIVHSMEGDVQAWLESGNTNPSPAEFLEQFLKEHPLPTTFPKPATYGVSQSTLEAAARYAATAGRTVDEMIVEWLELAATQDPGESASPAASQASTGFADLDDNARELLAKHLAENPELDARDVLNGAVTFLLSDEVEWTSNAKEEARNRRLAREATGKYHAALCALLDDEAAALVRRYLEVTAWNFTAADIVSGCVVHALGIAFENQKEAEEMSGLANPQEHDGAWGYVETRINDAACRRTGNEGTELKNPDDERTSGTGRVIIELVASDLSGEELDAQDREAYRHEHAKPNPADVALLAASAPEVEHPAPPPAEADEHLPVEEHVDEPEKGTAAPDGGEGK